MSLKIANLNEICRPRQWKTISATQLLNDGYTVYGANGKIGFYSEYTHENPTLMITCRGATCGNVNISEPKSYINGNAMALDELDESSVFIKYLYYFLLKRGFSDVISGSAQPQITGQGLEKVKIPLPPLPEQKRIAAILDKADSLRRKNQQTIQLANKFLRAVFLDMFGDPMTNPKGWEIKRMSNVCLKITDGTHHSPPITETGIPYITAKHLKGTGVEFYNDPWFISIESHKEIFARCNPEKGDVLYIKDGATTGVAAINEYDFEFSMLSSLALLKPNKDILLSEFLTMFLNHPRSKTMIIANMAGAAITRLTLAKIKEIQIPIPDVFQDSCRVFHAAFFLMFYEYAVDPAILGNIANFRTFCESFKNRPSRLIANLPKRWIQEAFSAINQMSHEECPPVMRKTLKENLKKLSVNSVCDNRPVDDWCRTQAWVDYAIVEHQKHPFSAIWASSPPTTEELVYSFSNLFFRAPTSWDSPSQLHLKRDANEMVTAIMPLLRVSKIVWLVDPHFSFTLPSWGRYKAILQKLIELSGEFNYGKGISRINIHTSDRNGGLQGQLNQKVKPLLSIGITVHCFQWPESQMHDRFILTDVGGVSFGHGLDEHTDNNLDEVLVSVLEYQTFKKEKNKLNGTPVSQSVVVGTV